MKWACVLMFVLDIFLMAAASIRIIQLPPMVRREGAGWHNLQSQSQGFGDFGAATTYDGGSSEPSISYDEPASGSSPTPAGEYATGDVPEGMEGAVGVKGRETYDVDVDSDDGTRGGEDLDGAKAKMRQKF